MSEDSASHAAQRTLLIIDDQQGVRLSLTFLLEGMGYRILAAESCRVALALAETEVFDAALIDVHMPGTNGFDTCVALQSKCAAQGRLLRAWLMTGVCTREVERRGMELGVIAVLRKPFEFPSFQEQLESGFAIPPRVPAPLPTLSCGRSATN